MQALYQINDFMENKETGQKFLLNGKETTQRHISKCNVRTTEALIM